MVTATPFILIAAPGGRFRVLNTRTGTMSLLAHDAVTARRMLHTLRSAPPLEHGPEAIIRIAARGRLQVAP